jgi:hypothetical protein
MFLLIKNESSASIGKGKFNYKHKREKECKVKIFRFTNTCIEEGNSVEDNSDGPRCCDGLELQPAEPGDFKSKGTCVANSHPSIPSVNGTLEQTKDLLPTRSDSEPKGSKANQQ